MRPGNAAPEGLKTPPVARVHTQVAPLARVCLATVQQPGGMLRSGTVAISCSMPQGSPRLLLSRCAHVCMCAGHTDHTNGALPRPSAPCAQVSAYGSDSQTDGGDLWTLEWDGKGKFWRQNTKVSAVVARGEHPAVGGWVGGGETWTARQAAGNTGMIAGWGGTATAAPLPRPCPAAHPHVHDYSAPFGTALPCPALPLCPHRSASSTWTLRSTSTRTTPSLGTQVGGWSWEDMPVGSAGQGWGGG